MIDSNAYIASTLLPLDYLLVQESPRLVVWENAAKRRRIILNSTIATYQTIMRTGTGREIASSSTPVNTLELLSQLQALNWA